MKAARTHSGRIEIGPGREEISKAAFACQRAWQSACRHDHIDPRAKFVVFSAGNPFVQFVDRAWTIYRETLASYQAGGYVGLTLA